MSAKVFLYNIAAVLLGIVLLTACNESKEAKGKTPLKETEVGIVTLQPETVILTNELAGRVTPLQSAEVRPQVTGIIQERLFQEGSSVKKGAPLYQIDSATYQVAVDTAAAQLAKAEASLSAARSKAQRGQGLATRGLISRDSQDDQLTAQTQAEADVAVAQAALKTARLNLAYTQVKAPLDGFIGKSAVTAGALVTANQATTLTTIQQLDPILVDITQSSTDLLKLQRDTAAPVKLRLADGSAYAHTGKLAFTDLNVDANTGSVTLRAEFPNPDRQLLPGMFVRAILGSAVRQNALLVPQQGVTRKANGEASVWVVKADHSLEKRTVQATQAVGSQWLVESGLQAGEQVVVDGLQKIKPDTKVKAVPVGGGK
jgi:membrane fusion protein (multidrug efflux system)